MGFGPVRALVFGFSVFRVHLLKLCGDLQRCLVLDLRDVELDEEPTADAEKQEYEEAEGMQMLLQRKEASLSQSGASDEQSSLKLPPSHHYDGKDHPQDKQEEPVDGTCDDVGG